MWRRWMSLRASIVENGYLRIVRPRLFQTDPEDIHEQMIRLLSGVGSALPSRAALKAVTKVRGKRVRVAGIDFPSRVGLAAGLDKDGTACLSWAGLGFGFAELGTVTAFPQPGNDRPRIFRAVESQGLINRMGFNNAGAAAMAQTLEAAGVQRGKRRTGIRFGVSIGKSKIVKVRNAVEDYLTSLTLLAPHADYIAINVSSPNTPGLRSLQSADALRELTQALVNRAATLDSASPVPIFVKVAPDLSEAELAEVVAICEENGISGLIATNTTLSREGLVGADAALAGEAGCLSGAPLRARALEVVGYLAAQTRLPIIGCGGVMAPGDAKALFAAGASLIQLYTGFIYGGPALAMQINAEDRRNA
jgi:dihydroorotate dehydrogenase